MNLPTIAFIFLTFATPAKAASEPATQNPAQPVATPSDPKETKEQSERAVDEAAYAAQSKSIQTLQGLLKKHAGKRQEPVLLHKLAELQSQNSSLLFRISHGRAHRSKQALDLRQFKTSIQQTIQTLDRLISKYPNFDEISSAHYLRGKAYEEIEDKARATQNYLTLVSKFPEALEVPSAYMALAQFAIDDNKHPQAIQYLTQVEKRPESPHYPFALYKLAWSHYNLKNIDEALKYSKVQIKFYQGRSPLSSSELALLENTLVDVPIFFIEGYEKDRESYSLNKAYEVFSSLETGPILGKMLARYAKLLRSHGHEAAIVDWQEKILASDSKRPEAIDVVSSTFEYQLNKRRYDKLVKTAQHFKTLYAIHKDSTQFIKAQKLLADTAESIRELTIKNKEATEVSTLTNTLTQLYTTFIEIVDDQDPRIARVHYNLAETFFTLRDYEGATTHYRWIVENKRETDTSEVSDSKLKAIGARYETLKLKQLIPSALVAQSQHEDQEQKSPLPTLLSEWMKWIDQTPITKTNEEKVLNFKFEAYRALYAAKHIKRSTQELTQLAESFPKSENAMAAASLALDTWIISQDWKQAHETATDFLDLKEWRTEKHKPFQERLKKVAADSYFKQIEGLAAGKNWGEVVSMTKTFEKKYKSDERFIDALILKGQAQTELGEREDALETFSKLSQNSTNPTAARDALLSRAKLFQEVYRFEDAAQSYLSTFSLPVTAPPKNLEEIQKHTLLTAYLSGNAKLLRSALGHKKICAGEPSPTLSTLCNEYQLFEQAVYSQGPLETEPSELIKRASNSSSRENRALLSWIALQKETETKTPLSTQDRYWILRELAQNWTHLKGPTQIALSAQLPVRVSQYLSTLRHALAKNTLKPNPKSIKRRVESMKELEEVSTELLKIPNQRLRAEVLFETAQLYNDFSEALKQLPPPDDLKGEELAAYEETVRKISIPFEEKEQQIREKSFEIASQGRIEQSTFKKIADAFFLANPSLAKKLKPTEGSENTNPKDDDLNLKTLDRFLPKKKYDRIARYVDDARSIEKTTDPSELSLRLRALWSQAIESKNFTAAQFFIGELERLHLEESPHLQILRAYTLSKAGAHSEGLSLLEESKKQISDLAAKDAIAITLLQNSFRTYTKTQLRKHLSELTSERINELNREEREFVAIAKEFAQ